VEFKNQTRLLVALCCCGIGLFVLGCGKAGPANAPSATVDSAESASYKEDVAQLVALNREAEANYKAGKADLAAKLMEQEKPLVARVLSPPKPSLAAMEAASDLDQLYGTMLLNNRHYGWARVMFQGNLARWKHWRPITEESTRRLKQAEAGIAECDKHLVE
jgi:hypothetical protein